jgi:hypothetical protein
MAYSSQSLGDKLSDTDPITNSVVISGLDFSRDGANLLRPGRYPGSCINSYIHESLHHMCFRSPVGSALSYLYHRAFQRALDYVTLGEASAHDGIDVLGDIVRVEGLLHLMRPLAEGIALFGEFDAFPGDAKSISWVFRNTAIAFAEHVPGSNTLQVDQILHELLRRARQSQLGRQRKENLLMQGLTTHRGGYLPGYIFVKNLQFSLFGHLGSRKLLDSEFYLHFITYWFYNDFSLVKTLLDGKKTLSPFTETSIAERDAFNAIAAAFQNRVKELFNRLTKEQVEHFDEMLVAEDRAADWWKIQIGTDLTEAKSIGEKLMADSNALIDFTSPGSQEQILARSVCHDNMIRRNYMCIGSFLEDIEINDGRAATIGRSLRNEKLPVVALGNSEKKGPYRGKAAIDVLQSGLSGSVFLTVYAENERVTIRSMAKNFEAEQKSLGDVNLSTEQCRLIKTWMRDIIIAAIGKDTTAAMLREHYKKSSEQSTEAIYRSWCGLVVGPEVELIEHPGALLSLAGGNTKFLRTIGALGCVGSPIINDQAISECCDEQGLSTADFMARAKAVELENKFRFLIPVGSYWALTV